MKSMTHEERTIANAALRAGPWENHDQMVMVVADGLKLEPQKVEAVLKRLRIRLVLNCLSTARDVNERAAASVRYEEGINWTDDE